MVIVISGKKEDGSDCSFYMDETLKNNLDAIKNRVEKRNWDFK